MTSAQGTARSAVAGISLAVASAFAFGLGGIFASPLLSSGWSPAGVAFARVLLATAVLAVPAALAMRGRWASMWQARRRVAAYAVIAIAGTQLAFYGAIERIPVGTALLVQYLAPVLLIVVIWARTRVVPARVVLVGSAIAVAGLALVIGPSGLSGGLDLVGVAFSGLAMIGVAAYFVLSAAPQDGVPPVALAGAGFAISAVVIGAVGATGLLPMRMQLGVVEVSGLELAWWVPLAALVLVSTSFSYVSGITAAGLLGARAASFFGLLEVVFATLAAWMLLGQSLGPLQIAGTALVVLGVVVVKLERTKAVTLATMPLPTVTMPLPIVTMSSSSLMADEAAVEMPVSVAVPTVTAPIDLMSFPTALPTPVPAESLAEPEQMAMPLTVPIDIVAPVDVIADAAVEHDAQRQASADEQERDREHAHDRASGHDRERASA